MTLTSPAEPFQVCSSSQHERTKLSLTTSIFELRTHTRLARSSINNVCGGGILCAVCEGGRRVRLLCALLELSVRCR